SPRPGGTIPIRPRRSISKPRPTRRPAHRRSPKERRPHDPVRGKVSKPSKLVVQEQATDSISQKAKEPAVVPPRANQSPNDGSGNESLVADAATLAGSPTAERSRSAVFTLTPQPAR